MRPTPPHIHKILRSAHHRDMPEISRRWRVIWQKTQYLRQAAARGWIRFDHEVWRPTARRLHQATIRAHRHATDRLDRGINRMIPVGKEAWAGAIALGGRVETAMRSTVAGAKRATARSTPFRSLGLIAAAVGALVFFLGVGVGTLMHATPARTTAATPASSAATASPIPGIAGGSGNPPSFKIKPTHQPSPSRPSTPATAPPTPAAATVAPPTKARSVTTSSGSPSVPPLTPITMVSATPAAGGTVRPIPTASPRSPTAPTPTATTATSNKGAANAPSAAAPSPPTAPPTTPTPVSASATPTAAVPPRRGVVYLVDASGSLIDSLPRAMRWVDHAVGELRSGRRFTILFFREGQVQEVPPKGMKTADEPTLKAVRQWIAPRAHHVEAFGRSSLSAALKRAKAYRPAEMFILSDDTFSRRSSWGDGPALLDHLRKAMGGTSMKVNTVQFFYRGQTGTLQAIADRFGGTYEFVTAKPRPATASSAPVEWMPAF